MDAVEYLKTQYRLCKSQDSCSGCAGCPLRDKEDGYCSIENISGRAGDAVQIVEQWAKEHPINTRQSEFLRMFPNAMINESDGILCITPCNIEGKSIGCPNGKSCGDCRREYWLTEVTDNGNVY
jgi:hypothetical protein